MWCENQDGRKKRGGGGSGGWGGHQNTHAPGPTIKSTFKNTRLETFFLTIIIIFLNSQSTSPQEACCSCGPGPRQFPGDVSPGQAPAPAPWRRSWWVQLDCFSFLRLEDTFLSQRKQPFQGFLRAGAGGAWGGRWVWLKGRERQGEGGQELGGCCLQERSE